MAVAPLGGDPARRSRGWPRSRPTYARAHPDATWISAGMSGDLEAAVAPGATHVRVGSAVLGPRPVGQVMSEAPIRGTRGTDPAHERHESRGIHERRDAQDGRLPRPARGRRRRLRRRRRVYDEPARREPSPRVRAAEPRRAGRQPRRAPASPAPRAPGAAPTATVAPMSRITTLHPRTYNEARMIGENFRDGVPVIMNLSEMDDADAKRLVDFAAGLVFAVRGTHRARHQQGVPALAAQRLGRRRGQAAHRRGRLLQPELTGGSLVPNHRLGSLRGTRRRDHRTGPQRVHRAADRAPDRRLDPDVRPVVDAARPRAGGARGASTRSPTRPIKALRRLIPPLRLGGVALDLSFVVAAADLLHLLLIARTCADPVRALLRPSARWGTSAPGTVRATRYRFCRTADATDFEMQGWVRSCR